MPYKRHGRARLSNPPCPSSTPGVASFQAELSPINRRFSPSSVRTPHRMLCKMGMEGGRLHNTGFGRQSSAGPRRNMPVHSNSRKKVVDNNKGDLACSALFAGSSEAAERCWQNIRANAHGKLDDVPRTYRSEAPPLEEPPTSFCASVIPFHFLVVCVRESKQAAATCSRLLAVTPGFSCCHTKPEPSLTLWLTNTNREAWNNVGVKGTLGTDVGRRRATAEQVSISRVCLAPHSIPFPPPSLRPSVLCYHSSLHFTRTP
eukprot:896510-Rhodomonas_salina.1